MLTGIGRQGRTHKNMHFGSLERFEEVFVYVECVEAEKWNGCATQRHECRVTCLAVGFPNLLSIIGIRGARLGHMVRGNLKGEACPLHYPSGIYSGQSFASEFSCPI